MPQVVLYRDSRGIYGIVTAKLANGNLHVRWSDGSEGNHFPDDLYMVPAS